MADKGHPHEKSPNITARDLKERELATQLTVAMLRAGRSHDATIDELAERVASIYGKMPSVVGPEPPPNG